MKAATEGRAQRAVKQWVYFYTWGLPIELRDRRRSEIESDQWEQEHDARLTGRGPEHLAWQVLGRWLFGMPADLAWRFETGGLARRGGGLLFAALAVIGMWMALLGPGIPDFDAPAHEITAFYAGKGAQLITGHVLLWASAALFMGFVVRLHGILRGAKGGRGWLPHIVLASGIAAGAMLCLAFAFTSMAAYNGSTGLNLEAVRTLYPMGGFAFHILMSGALALFLAATAAAAVRTKVLPHWAAWAGGILALLFLLESIGAGTMFLLPQILFLGWTVIVSFELGKPSPDIRPSGLSGDGEPRHRSPQLEEWA